MEFGVAAIPSVRGTIDFKKKAGSPTKPHEEDTKKTKTRLTGFTRFIAGSIHPETVVGKSGEITPVSTLIPSEAERDCSDE